MTCKRKATRLLMVCYSTMALTAAAEGRFAHSAAALAMAAAHRVCEDRAWAMAYAAMALVCVLEGRYVGALGFAAALAHHDRLSAPLLAMHYGLVGLDAEDEPGIGRLASAAAALNYAVV